MPERDERRPDEERHVDQEQGAPDEVEDLEVSEETADDVRGGNIVTDPGNDRLR